MTIGFGVICFHLGVMCLCAQRSGALMNKPWQTVRVFVSSTFRDMHAERDYLTRVVFPELRERMAKRHLHLVDVDLRWGVTEEEAEQGKILEVCLDEIERCRPFFICLLGERYGWTPSVYEVSEEKKYDWVREIKPGISITELEIVYGVLLNPSMKMRAFFYFRDPIFIASVPKEYKAVYLPEDKESAKKLKRLKNEIRRRHYPIFSYSCSFGGINKDRKLFLLNLETFGQRVLEDLWSSITQVYPKEPILLDELEVERAYHEAFIEGRCQNFVGRNGLLQQITAYANSDNDIPLVITGAPGCGKTALLANFARAYSKTHNDVTVLSHFIGASPGSNDIRKILLRLSRELVQRLGISNAIPEDYDKLKDMFLKLLDIAANQRKVVIILDALNQLDHIYFAHSLNWLPAKLPHGLKLVLSTRDGKFLEVLRCRRPYPLEISVGPLETKDRKQIIRLTLGNYRKKLDEREVNDQMGLLLNKDQSDNPLYIIVVTFL